MKKAFVDQIVLWITGFIFFVILLFMTIEYAQALRIKENLDAISNYGARMVALGKTNEEIAAGLDGVKLGIFGEILPSDIICISSESQTYQAIFVAKTTYVNDFLEDKENNVNSKTIFFNESSSNEINCELRLEPN